MELVHETNSLNLFLFYFRGKIRVKWNIGCLSLFADCGLSFDSLILRNEKLFKPIVTSYPEPCNIVKLFNSFLTIKDRKFP